MASENDLPEGWSEAQLSDVVQTVPNVAPHEAGSRLFRYVDISSIDNERNEVVDPRTFKGRDAPSRARRPIRAGDVLFSNVRTYLKNIAVVPAGLDGQLASTGFTVLRPTSAILTGYLFRSVLSDAFVDVVTPQQTGSNYPATCDRVVKAQEILLPPLAEQKRIVEMAEKLLARVDAARSCLDRVPAILKRFRQAVLTAACSGQLTEGQDSHGRGVHRGDDWRPMTLVDLCKKAKHSIKRGPFGSALKKAFFVPSGHKVYEQQNAIHNDCERGTYFVDRAKFDELGAFRVGPGDLIISCSGTIGRIAVLPDNAPVGIINQALLKLSLDSSVVLTDYFVYLFQHSVAVAMRAASRGSAMMNLASVKELKKQLFRVPGLALQRETVRRVQSLFALADAIEKRVEAATARASKLEQAVLARAFRGELVPPEAELARREGRSYEPASELLARIRADREARESREAEAKAAKKEKKARRKRAGVPKRAKKPRRNTAKRRKKKRKR